MSSTLLYQKLVLSLITVFFLVTTTFAQESEADTSKTEKIEVIYADLQRTIKKNNSYIRILEGNVKILKDSSFFYADTAVVSDKYLQSWGNVSMLKNDSVRVFADSMAYEIEAEEADIYGSVFIENGKQVLFSDYIHFDDKNDIAYYTEKAILQNDSTILKSQRGEFRLAESLAIFSHKVSVKNDQFQLYADTLLYNTDEDKAIFKGPTNIIQDSSTIYCESGYYFIEKKLGEFSENAIYKGNDDDEAKGDTIRFDGAREIVELIGDAYYQSENTYAEGDYIKYQAQKEEVYIKGNGYVKDESQSLRSEEITYNKRTKEFSSSGRSNIDMDSGTNLIADEINSKDGIGNATGTITMIDSTNEVRLDGEHLQFNREENYYELYSDNEQALMRTVFEDGDSLYMVADTFINQKVITIDTIFNYEIDTSSTSQTIDKIVVDSILLDDGKWELDSILLVDTIEVMVFDSTELMDINIDTTEYLTGNKMVKMLTKDLQLICDSLVYNRKDSIINLYKDPIMWSDSTQFSADSIVVYIKNNTIHSIEMFPKALIVNTEDELFFNQIRGNHTTAYFDDGQIDSMNVVGNAQSLYYLIDDDGGYISVNKTECSSMTFYFEEKKLENIYFWTDPTSEMFPMHRVNHDEIKLEGFHWSTHRRPMDRASLHPLLNYAMKEDGQLENSVTE